MLCADELFGVGMRRSKPHVLLVEDLAVRAIIFPFPLLEACVTYRGASRPLLCGSGLEAFHKSDGYAVSRC